MYKHIWRKALLITIAATIALFLMGFFFLDHYLTSKITQKLKAAVLIASDSLYRINFDKAELHLFRGKAVFNNILLIPDTNVYRRMKKRGMAPAIVYKLKVEQLLVAEIHPFELYFYKKLEIGQLMIKNPEVWLNEYTRKDQQQTPKDSRTLYQKLSKNIRSINIGNINLDNIRLNYETFIGPKPQKGVLKNMDLKATDLLIDSTTQHDLHRTLYCQEIITRLNHFSGTTADGLYQFRFRSVSLSTRLSRLTLTGLTMLPLPPKTFFAKSKLDHFNLYLDSVTVDDINLKNLRLRPDLDIAKMTITKGRFNIYPNPHGIIKKGNRKVSFPNYVVGHMKSILSVDTLDLRHIDVSYTEYNAATKQSGTINFDNTAGRFLHISNKKGKVALYPWSTAKLTTYLMGKGKLDLAVGFKLNDEREQFYYSGHLGTMDLKDGNSVLIPLGLARAASGTVKSLTFNINGSEKATTGKVTFLYNDLKAELLRHNKDGYSKKKLISFVANLLILKDNNPDKLGGIPRSQNVIYLRPKNVAFFKSIWLTLFSGIKPCVGLGKANASGPHP